MYVPEWVFFPFTAALRFRIRITLFLMGAASCGFGAALGESAFFVLTAFFVLSDIPMELTWGIMRQRRTRAYCNGERSLATVVKKYTYPIGPQFGVRLRYRVNEATYEPQRQMPYAMWLRLRIGDSLSIRVQRGMPDCWVFCWAEPDTSARSRGIAKQGQNGGDEAGLNAEHKDEGAE